MNINSMSRYTKHVGQIINLRDSLLGMMKYAVGEIHR